MAETEAVKRKEPEPEKKDDGMAVEAPAASEAKPAEAEAKPAEPEAKRLKPNPPDAGVVRKQIEYYLSDDNLKFDKFFHDKISGNSEGWLELALVLNCKKMKDMRATTEDVLAALKDSKIEVKEDTLSIRRPGNAALPTLEARPAHMKKNVAHAHDGGVITVVKDIPADQKWAVIKDKLREKLPEKVAIWFVSEVSDKKSCTVATAPFDGDIQFFEELQLEVEGAKLTVEVAQGDLLQQSLKLLPKHICDKRKKEAGKKHKERNRPILVGSQRFVNVGALRTRVKEIMNARSDGEQLKPESSDYKLIQALLGFHPKGDEKSKGMVGIKVGPSPQGGNRCFWMLKDDGKEEDFSAMKCLSAIEVNPPYVDADAKKEKNQQAGSSPNTSKPEDSPKADAAAASAEKKEEEDKKEEKEEPAAA